LLITRQPLGLTRSVEWSGMFSGSSVAAINHLFRVFPSQLFLSPAQVLVTADLDPFVEPTRIIVTLSATIRAAPCGESYR
jgi:hypothetical protein